MPDQNAPAAPAAAPATPTAPAAPARLSNFAGAIAANVARANASTAPATPTAPQPAPASTPVPGQPSALAQSVGARVEPPGQPGITEQQFLDTLGAPEEAGQATEATDQTEPSTLEQELGTDAEPTAPDWDAPLHGTEVTARQLIDAVQAGQLPKELLGQLRVTATVNGQPLEISAHEAVQGYQRLSDTTRIYQETRAQQQAAQQLIDRNTAIWDAWQDPQEFARGMQVTGLMPAARAAMTAGWGTNQQPNGQALLDDMYRFGMEGPFSQAAMIFAARVADEEAEGTGLRYTNPALYQDLMRQRSDHWQRVRKQEQQEHDQARQQWSANVQQMRQARAQQQQQDPETQQAEQQLTALRDHTMKQHGLEPSDQAVGYYFQHYLGILIEQAAQSGYQRELHEIVRDAAQATRETIGQQPVHQTNGHAHQVAPTAPPTARNGTGLPARPTGAPLAPPSTSTNGLPRSGRPSDLAKRLSGLNGLAARQGRR